MDSCSKCGAILKTKEGGYTSELNTNKVIFTQIKSCDNDKCSNFGLELEIIKHEMN